MIEHTARIASHWIGLNHNQLLVLLALQVRRRVFVRILPACIDHLLDVVGRSDDNIDHVTVDDVHEAMLHPVKRDYPLTPIRVVAQTPCDMVAYLNLRSGLAEINVPTVVQFKAHDAPRKTVHIGNDDTPVRGDSCGNRRRRGVSGKETVPLRGGVRALGPSLKQLVIGMDANSGEPWSEMDVEDLRHSLDYGNTFAATARFLCRDEDEVRQKARALGLTEHPGKRVRVVR